MKYLLVGLGNIGNEYASTRHNIGFDVVNTWVQKLGASFSVEKHAYMAKTTYRAKQVICICPTTYMNLSGKAVKYWMNAENILLSNVLIVMDDLALPLDALRLRATGSAAGHNGLKSVEEYIGTKDYARLRFGIGNQFPKGMQSDFVLGKWRKEEIPLVKFKIEKSIEVIEAFVFRGISDAMQICNQKKYTV